MTWQTARAPQTPGGPYPNPSPRAGRSALLVSKGGAERRCGCVQRCVCSGRRSVKLGGWRRGRPPQPRPVPRLGWQAAPWVWARQQGRHRSGRAPPGRAASARVLCAKHAVGRTEREKTTGGLLWAARGAEVGSPSARSAAGLERAPTAAARAERQRGGSRPSGRGSRKGRVSKCCCETRRGLSSRAL